MLTNTEDAPGSLIFGGYDASRFDEASTLRSATHQWSMFSLQGANMTVSDASQLGPQLINQPPFVVAIDFSVTSMMLPEAVCQDLERMLGISWDSTSSIYRISNARHEELMKRNINMTISLHGEKGSHQDFVLPYSSLVLEAKPPMVNEATKYLGIQKGHASTQIFTFGRVFLQETYFTAALDDRSGSHFRLSQAHYNKDTPSRVVEIVTPGYGGGSGGSPKSTKPMGVGTILGIIIAIVSILVLAGYLLLAKKTGRFPFGGAASRAPKAEDYEEHLSDLTAVSSSRRLEVVDERGESRLSKADSVYYEALDELPDQGPSGKSDEKRW
jgi:hypothetical protein